MVTTTKSPDMDDTAIDPDEEEERDNRDLVDTHGANQTLTAGDIATLRVEVGMSGIVDALVKNSATFGDKTKFSQEKYIKKKRQKYAVVFYLDRVTVPLLCELNKPTRKVDVDTEPSEWPRFRMDHISQLWLWSGIHSASRVLVIDGTNGLLPACLLARLGPEGKLFQVLLDNAQPNMSVSLMMQLPMLRERWACVKESVLEEALNSADVSPLLTGKADRVVTASSTADVTIGSSCATSSSTASRPGMWLNTAVAVSEAFGSGLPDALVVAGDFSESDLIRRVRAAWPFLALSGAIAVGSPTLLPVAQLALDLRRPWALAVSKEEEAAFGPPRMLHEHTVTTAVRVSVWDTWMRDYQVLPNRTHPTVNMSHDGGFLLSGVKVSAVPAAPRSLDDRASAASITPTASTRDPTADTLVAQACDPALLLASERKRSREQGDGEPVSE